MKKRYLPYLITFIVGLFIMAGISLLIYLLDKTTDYKSEKNLVSLFMDSATATGICMVCVALIKLVAGQGVFDGLGFAVENIFVVRNWSKRRFSERENFGEYKERKEQMRKDRKYINAHIYVVGAIFFVASIVLMIVYNNL